MTSKNNRQLNYRYGLIKCYVRVEVGKIFCVVKHPYNCTPQKTMIADQSVLVVIAPLRSGCSSRRLLHVKRLLIVQ